jgi:hypothetical protein
MENKRNTMGRHKMVNISDIILPNYNATINDALKQKKINTMVEKFGQFKIIIVCQVESLFRIIDGVKAFKSYEQNGDEKILCYDLGELSEVQELAYRLLLNTSFSRLDYIGIASAISKVCKTSKEANNLSNAAGIPITDVQRYQTLLAFDWNEFLNKKIDNNQINLF